MVTFSSHRRLLSSTNRNMYNKGVTNERTHVSRIRNRDRNFTVQRHATRVHIRNVSRDFTFNVFTHMRQARFNFRQVFSNLLILQSTSHATGVIKWYRRRYELSINLFLRANTIRNIHGRAGSFKQGPNRLLNRVIKVLTVYKGRPASSLHIIGVLTKLNLRACASANRGRLAITIFYRCSVVIRCTGGIRINPFQLYS